jgi:hypothetical protein
MLDAVRVKVPRQTHWHAFSAAEIAEAVASNIVRYAELLIDRQHRSAVLEMPILAARWPLREGFPRRVPAGDDPQSVKARHLQELMLYFSSIDDEPSRWPAEVAPVDVAEALERTGSDEARTVANALREGRFYVDDDGNLITYKVRRGGTIQYPDESDVHAEYQWPPVACATLVMVERLVRGAYAQHTTVPRTAALALSHVRSGYCEILAKPTVEIDVSARTYNPGLTFATPASGTKYYKFTLPPKTQLSLPIADKIDPDYQKDPFASARETLSGMTLRVWLATWVLSERNGDDGLFLADIRKIIFDIFCMKPTFTTSKGKIYERPSPRDEARVKAALTQLERVMLCGFNDFTLEKPEPVIRRTPVKDSAGRGFEIYQHSAFAWAEARRNFVQIPTVALRLDATHSDLVLGIGNVLRIHASRWLKKGELTMSLDDFAHEAGQPVEACLRREGRAFWKRLQERVALVVTAGGFGTARFGSGDGGDVRLSIEPREDLGIVYRSLLEAIERRQRQQSVAGANAAEVKALLAANVRGGRPRKPLG